MAVAVDGPDFIGKRGRALARPCALSSRKAGPQAGRRRGRLRLLRKARQGTLGAARSNKRASIAGASLTGCSPGGDGGGLAGRAQCGLCLLRRGSPIDSLRQRKCLVSRILPDGTRQRTRSFSGLQSHYLFEDRYGRPGKGNDKGM